MGNYDFALDLESNNTQSVIINWIKQNSRVLEFGSANGRLTKYLSEEKKCKVTIVEYDYDSGKEASNYAEQAYIGPEQGDALKDYWHVSGDFDYIIFADVLEHLSDPKGVLIEAVNHLKPEGEILVSIPNVAHNSIIIDLINDRFDYQKTGLLDQTHIHFFTYNTFVEMMQKVGLSIVDEKPIYSTVGANEINNTYQDVPYDVERFLRKRATGSVYQFVFRLAKGKQKSKSFKQPFIQEKSKKFDSQCFYTLNNEEVFDDNHKESVIIEEGQKVTFEFELGKNINRVRFDPILEPCILKLSTASYIDEKDNKKKLPLESGNYCFNEHNMYIFSEDHPCFYYRTNNKYIKKIVFIFEVIKASIDKDAIGKMLSAIGKGIK